MGIKVKDIAKKLNISSSTVSLVLNNKPGISENTRKKVLEAMKELGGEELIAYDKSDKKNILFLVYRKYGMSPSVVPYFSQIFSEIIEGVENQVKRRGFNLLISYVDENTYKEDSSKIKSDNVEGVLILATEMEESQLAYFESLEIPIVIIDNYIEERNLKSITINNYQGIYKAIKYLCEMGHKDIGYLHVVKNAPNFEERYFGFFRAMKKFGLEINQKNIVEISAVGTDGVYEEILKKLKEKENLPRAFYADNDIVAMCGIRALKELGYHVPEDISIIGFDNMTMSEFLEPSIDDDSDTKI